MGGDFRRVRDNISQDVVINVKKQKKKKLRDLRFGNGGDFRRIRDNKVEYSTELFSGNKTNEKEQHQITSTRLNLETENNDHWVEEVHTNNSDGLNNTHTYNEISDSDGDSSGEDEPGDNESAVVGLSSATIPPSHLGWANISCASGGNCTDNNCCGGSSSSDEDENDVGPTTKTSSLVRGQHIRISGGFNITQSNLITELEALGAASVETGRTLGKATILIKGTNCKDVLLKSAKERNQNEAEQNVLILNEVELIARLYRDGCSLSASITSTNINESNLADQYIDKCHFMSVNSQSSSGLKKKCDMTLPTELEKCYNDDEVVIEYGDHNFTDPRIRFKQGDNKNEKRQMNIRVIRTKRKGEIDWQYHYKFYYIKSGGQLFPYCVQHDRIRYDCKKCNKCTHLDPVKGDGFPNPHKQCIICCPWIACKDCGMEAQKEFRSAHDPESRNRCARCYRLATGNARIEDICIEFIRNANIPISSANKEVFGGLSYRPDAEITESPLNDISYECDDEKGHIYYPVNDQHQRTVELNERRLDEKGKVTIRQHPVHIWDSTQQTEQNQVMANTIIEYLFKDLGQRSDRQGGKRVIVFIGHSCTNPHYKRAIEEKKHGYWDEVFLIDPITPNRKWLENDGSSILGYHTNV